MALSGGGDSLALLHVVADWSDRHGRPVLAFTVDHGLNPASPGWNVVAREAAERVGASWRGLVWVGEKPPTGLPAAARTARHALIAQAAREGGAKVLLFGHTADDVAESDHMRATDIPNLGRLKSWSPSPAWPQGRGLFLCRPLLTTARVDLRVWLEGAGQKWIEDPSNADLRFSRSRARAAAGLAKKAAPPVSNDPDVPPPIVVTLDGRLVWSRPHLKTLPLNALTRLLGLAMVCAGGGDRPPAAATLAQWADRVRGGESFIATAAGARLTADALSVQAAREAGERKRSAPATPMLLHVGEEVVWDGRYLIAADAPGWVVDVADGRLSQLAKAHRTSLAALPPAARRAAPALIHPRSGKVRLPAPFGDGPARTVGLVADRFAAARGGVTREADIWSLSI